MTRPTGGRGWTAVLAAFDEVVELDQAARQQRLGAIGASDAELRRALEHLLAADSRADVVLTRFDDALGDATRDRDSLHLAGRTVAHFRVIEPLGRGGMGMVYRAEDLRLGRTVALKVPLAARHVDPAGLERFRQEARAAATLDHPNICSVYETGETADGDLFFAMPLYEGETLKARLARQGKLPVALALDIAVQLARGLGAAHRAGIVHRDVKPANVMLLVDDAVKLLDFGLAKASDVSLTASWARLGTVAYMAPEQVVGHQVDRRADLWALGVVLHEMVTGRRPFEGGHEVGVAHAILHRAPPRASALRDDIPPELDGVLRTCLRKDPRERYQSAEELEASLERIRHGDGARPAGRSRWPRIGIDRRLPWRRSLIVAAGLLIAVEGALLARGRSTAPSAPVALAVLPFGWTGDSAGTHDLAVGLSDGIGTELGRLRGVIAPSYLTTSIYGDSSASLTRIGAQLEVGAVLRGGVQRVNERVRVDAQLVDVHDGRRLWARRFERPANELPEIQRDMVRAVVATLRIRATDSERAVLDHPATTDARAYDAYLRGRAMELAGQSRNPWDRPPLEVIRNAQALYSRARTLDPGFAAAHARLALMHTRAAASYDMTEGRRAEARVEAETALRLQPGLPEAHEALANYWDLSGDLSRATEEMALALAGFPHSADLHLALGDLLARAGRVDEAVAEFDQAMRLDPGSPKAAFAAAVHYSRLRRRDDALRAFNRALALAPDFHLVKVIKGQAYLRWTGVPDTLEAAMRSVPADWDPNGMATYGRYSALWVQRRYADGLVMLDRSRSRMSRDTYVYQPISLMRARLRQALGERTLARVSYGRARAILEDSVAAHPADPNIHVSLALAYAGLGRTAAAVREARRAMALAPIAGGTARAAAVMAGAVEVFAQAGETDAALDLLELLFSMPAGREVTVPFLRAWPGFDPLRGDPRFETLLRRFSSDR